MQFWKKLQLKAPGVVLLAQYHASLLGSLCASAADEYAEIGVRPESCATSHLLDGHVGVAQVVVGQPQQVGGAEVLRLHARQYKDERVDVLGAQSVDFAELHLHVLALRQPSQEVVHHLHARRVQVARYRFVVRLTVLVIPPLRREGRDVQIVHCPLWLALILPRRSP